MTTLNAYMHDNPWKTVPSAGDIFAWKKGDIRILSLTYAPADTHDDPKGEALNRVEVLFVHNDKHYTIRGVEYTETVKWNINTLTNKKPLFNLSEQSVWGGYEMNQFLPYSEADNVR